MPKPVSAAQPDAPRVRIHLNLGKAEAAQSSVQMRDENGTWKVAAYADGMVLKNVRPVIDQTARKQIEQGLINKRPIAFLEGDMVAWTGEANPKSDAGLSAQLTPFQEPDMDRVERRLRLPPKRFTGIGFNPKKASEFFPLGDMSRAVTGGGHLLARHWDFQLTDIKTRAMRPDEIAQDAAPATLSEQRTISKGRARTAAYLGGRNTGDDGGPAQSRPRMAA